MHKIFYLLFIIIIAVFIIFIYTFHNNNIESTRFNTSDSFHNLSQEPNYNNFGEFISKHYSGEPISSIPSKIINYIKTKTERDKVGQVDKIISYDFDNDGIKEFLVGERLISSSSPLRWYILFIEDNEIKEAEPSYEYRNLKQGRLRGHNNIFITEDGLIKEIAPIYLEDDANAAPTGGIAIFYFKFLKGKIIFLNAEFINNSSDDMNGFNK